MRSWRREDPLLWLCPILLWLLGLAELLSLSRGSSYPIELCNRQLAIGIVGVGLSFGISKLAWQTIAKFVPIVLALATCSLMATLWMGTTINGAERWLSLGPLGSFQPSELAKLLSILYTARIMSLAPSVKAGLIKVLALVGTLAGLIFCQPDLGTALVLTASCLLLALIAGAPWKPILGLGAAGITIAPFILSDYQWERLHIFISPGSDLDGTGWNLEQSKIAIGSGGLLGKGAFQGLQGPLGFLPEAHSDFIFSALSEEFGFLASLLVVLLLATIVGRLFRHGRNTSLPQRRLVLIGLGLHFALHGILNLAMTVGIVPVTGSPLPFMSYGGTALLLNFCAIGLAQGILRDSRQV